MSENSDVVVKADPASPKLLPLRTVSIHPANASPRSSDSADQHQSPRSPFLHSLHHRLHKGSGASSSIHSSDASIPGGPSEVVDKAEAARSARRFLLSTVRNDWEWPPQDVKEELQDETLEDGVEARDELSASREPIGWRTREEGPSDMDNDSDGSFKGKRRRRSDPYKFENPDAIAASIVEKKLRRKRKIEHEMQWNEGLKLWSERRDAWTAAVRTKPPPVPVEEEKVQINGNDQSQKKRNLSISHIIHRSSVSTKPDRTESTTGDKAESPRHPSPASQTASPTIGSPSVSSFPQSSSTSASTLDPDPNAPYLPVFPPLFPTSHTLRARIKPPAYPTIYSKVVIRSLTPNVPIPLTHMIGALVDGWKSEGNWPPSAAAQEAAANFRQKQKPRSHGAFARWRHDQDEKRRLKRISAGAEPGVHGHGIMKEILPVEEGDFEKKGFRRSLTGAVKKVLGMHEGDEDSDGGLERMGVKFVDEQEFDQESEDVPGTQGLMREGKDVLDDNIVLNRGLVEEKG